MKNVRINVIGAGHWGPNLVRAFYSISGVSVGMVTDLNRDRLSLLAENFPDLRTTTDPAEAIRDKEADAIAIVTPVVTHYQLAREALQAGKHVFVEKPLSRTVDESEELIQLAAESNRTLMVGHIFHFNPGIVKVKELIDTGALGSIIYIDAVRTNLGPIRNDVNALWDLASHDFSIFDYWLGLPALGVSATGKRVSKSRLEDVVFATVHYERGPTAHVHASWLNPRKVRQITVVGENKMVVWDDIDLSHAVQIYSHGVSVTKDDYADTFGAHRLSYHTGDLLVPQVKGGEPLRMECLHFIDCIRTGNRPKTDGPLGKRVVEILTAADRSMADGGSFAGIQ
jgi:predicted dehydrogenase